MPFDYKACSSKSNLKLNNNAYKKQHELTPLSQRNYSTLMLLLLTVMFLHDQMGLN